MAFQGWNRGWMLGGALLLCLAGPVQAQAPYVPDVTEAREKEWRKLVAASQSAYALGRAADGIDPARKALALADELFGVDDPRTLISVNDLALQLDSTGHFREAEGLLRRVFESYNRTRGEDDPNTQLALENLVDFYLARKRYDAAGPLADYALSSFRRTTGASSAQSRRMEQIIAALPKEEKPPEPVVTPDPAMVPAASQAISVEKIPGPVPEGGAETQP